METPSQRAATTRRIRKRAAQWQGLARPAPADLADKLQEHLTEASRATWTRPPLSAEAVAWKQLEYLGEAYSYLNRARRAGKVAPGYIGGLRLARTGTAALLDALSRFAIEPAPSRAPTIEAGDLIENGGALARVVRVRSDASRYLFHLEGGAVVAVANDEEIPAIRPADFRVWNDERKAREDAERERQDAARERILSNFHAAFLPAWQARDWQAVRGAISACYAAWPETGNRFGKARDFVKWQIARITGQPHDRRQTGTGRKTGAWADMGFKGHMRREGVLCGRLAWLRGLPGYDPSDRREAVKVRRTWGDVVFVSGASLRGERWGDWVTGLTAQGRPSSRAKMVHCDTIAEILPAKPARKVDATDAPERCRRTMDLPLAA